MKALGKALGSRGMVFEVKNRFANYKRLRAHVCGIMPVALEIIR